MRDNPRIVHALCWVSFYLRIEWCNTVHEGLDQLLGTFDLRGSARLHASLNRVKSVADPASASVC